MKTVLILLIFQVCVLPSVLADPLKLEGTIGSYSIEVEIIKSDRLEGTFSGRYRYVGKKNYIDLDGMIFGNCLQIAESYNDQLTGEFYLTMEGRSLNGKWVNESKWYEVSLHITSGDRSLLEAKSLSEYAEETSPSITGSYGNENYFINDMWFDEDGHPIEIGFNGGYVVIEDLGGDSLAFQVEAICGPTYHFAYAAGIAHKMGDHYEYRLDDDCIITLNFSDKSVHMAANASFECGFGARAYLEHDFTKVNDQIDFGEHISLSGLKRMGRE